MNDGVLPRSKSKRSLTRSSDFSKNVLLPPWTTPGELRLLLKVDYEEVMRLCGSGRWREMYYSRRDAYGNAMKFTSKKDVLIPFEEAAEVCAKFGLAAVEVDPDPAQIMRRTIVGVLVADNSSDSLPRPLERFNSSRIEFLRLSRTDSELLTCMDGLIIVRGQECEAVDEFGGPKLVLDGSGEANFADDSIDRFISQVSASFPLSGTDIDGPGRSADGSRLKRLAKQSVHWAKADVVAEMDMLPKLVGRVSNFVFDNQGRRVRAILSRCLKNDEIVSFDERSPSTEKSSRDKKSALLSRGHSSPLRSSTLGVNASPDVSIGDSFVAGALFGTVSGVRPIGGARAHSGISSLSLVELSGIKLNRLESAETPKSCAPGDSVLVFDKKHARRTWRIIYYRQRCWRAATMNIDTCDPSVFTKGSFSVQHIDNTRVGDGVSDDSANDEVETGANESNISSESMSGFTDVDLADPVALVRRAVASGEIFDRVGSKASPLGINHSQSRPQSTKSSTKSSDRSIPLVVKAASASNLKELEVLFSRFQESVRDTLLVRPRIVHFGVGPVNLQDILHATLEGRVLYCIALDDNEQSRPIGTSGNEGFSGQPNLSRLKPAQVGLDTASKLARKHRVTLKPFSSVSEFAEEIKRQCIEASQDMKARRSARHAVYSALSSHQKSVRRGQPR